MNTSSHLLGDWKLWSNSKPTESGFYWIAGYKPETDSKCALIYSPIVWDFNCESELDIENLDPVILHGFQADEFIWSGPIALPLLGRYIQIRDAD